MIDDDTGQPAMQTLKRRLQEYTAAPCVSLTYNQRRLLGNQLSMNHRAEGQNATIKGNTVLACVARAIATVSLFYVLWCGGLAVCLYGVGHRPTHTVRLARLIERWITRLTVYRPGT